MNILQITVILVVSTGFGDDQFFGGGGMVVASMYPASRRVVNQSVVRTLHTEIQRTRIIQASRLDHVTIK